MNRVVNPPDIAVALHYDGESAPRVTAKGRGAVAEQIIERARQQDIPLHADEDVATVLAKVPLGSASRRELCLAVAEVIGVA